MILREDLRHVIVRDMFLLVELIEHPFSEGLSDCFKIYLQELGKYAVLPVPVSEESLKVRMEV